MFDSFESFCWWMLIIFWLIAVGFGQLFRKTTEVVKVIVEDETVQETGKGLLARWLDSLFKS